MLTVKIEDNQWNKSELNSRYLEYECNNRILDVGILTLDDMMIE